MVWFLVALAILLLGGLIAVVLAKTPRAASLVGAGSAAVGSALAMLPAIRVLVSGKTESLTLAWSAPFGSANMKLDPLAAIFVAVISLVTALAAIYGRQYLQSHTAGGKQGFSWLAFNLLAVGMLVVVTAWNGVLFLVSWELMSLASFFLVTHDDEKENVRRAGWVYLVAMHLGTAFLLALFLLLGKGAGSLDFERFSTAAAPSGVLFVLAVIGFGTKAGFIPMHVWLPEAHPAAPSHVSAVMSGVMIKTGIYGLLRILTLLGEPPPWWGWTLVAIGVVSGVLGVLYALAQHDLKRLLAYHSVENIGIISLGLGVGTLGLAYDNPLMAALGFTGGLLHVVNHAIFKSLLFLGAGAVLHATGTGDLDRLGGLLKRMPVTGATFLIGAAAISGLPPLNGFVSEFLIYLGAIAGLDNASSAASATLLTTIAVVGGLALIGGLAAACFTKAFGIVFLGEPRTDEASHAHEAGAAMRWPMIVLAALCIVIGLTAPFWPTILRPAVQVVTNRVPLLGTSSAELNRVPLLESDRVQGIADDPSPPQTSRAARVAGPFTALSAEGGSGPAFTPGPLAAPSPFLSGPFHGSPGSPIPEHPLFQAEDGRWMDASAAAAKPLTGVILASYILLGLIVLLVQVRAKLLAGRPIDRAVTWDCGYVAPTPRMQYTASSFARPLVILFRLFLRPRDEAHPPQGLFPRHAALHTHTPDVFRRYIYEPLFLGVAWAASKLRWLQEGRIQIYVLYIALTILALLIWKLG